MKIKDVVEEVIDHILPEYETKYIPPEPHDKSRYPDHYVIARHISWPRNLNSLVLKLSTPNLQIKKYRTLDAADQLVFELDCFKLELDSVTNDPTLQTSQE